MQPSTSSVAPRANAVPRVRHPREPDSRAFVIEGVMRSGKPFRPQGAGIGAHIGYSPYCVPRVVAGVKCVIVSEALRDLEPMAWDFVMNFARDNELRLHERAPADLVGA